MNTYPWRSKAKSSLQGTTKVWKSDTPRGFNRSERLVLKFLPGGDKGAEDHSEHCGLHRHGEGLSLRGNNRAVDVMLIFARMPDVRLREVKRTYFNRSPSKIMVRRILNLRRTVNIGKLQYEEHGDIYLFFLFVFLKGNNGESSHLIRCVPNSPDIWFPTYSRGSGNIWKCADNSNIIAFILNNEPHIDTRLTFFGILRSISGKEMIPIIFPILRTTIVANIWKERR